MKKTVFYSWQSDSPKGTNRNFIESALKEAAREIAADDSVDIEPVIDRDTQGVAGAPDISTTILKKIVEADLFVADVSFVGKTSGKSKKKYLPNPNVLVELGYAMKAKGPEALILVFNTAYGKVEDLPFDLKMKRTLTYMAREIEEDRTQTKKDLVRALKAALIAGLGNITPVQPLIPIVEIIEQNAGNKIVHLRRYLTKLLQSIEALEPKMYRDGGTASDIIEAIAKTESIGVDFSNLVDIVALMNDTDSALEIFKWFARLLEKYQPPANEAGKTSRVDGEFYKFIGHEFFTMFVIPFFREDRWDIISKILSGVLRIEPIEGRGESIKESWTNLSSYTDLIHNKGKENRRKSLHADLLEARHTEGGLATVSPFREFKEIDFMLSLYGIEETQGEFQRGWYPRSILYLDHVPTFVREAVERPYAVRLSRVLGSGNIDELKKRLEDSKTLGFDRHTPLTRQDIDSIGSTGNARIVT